MRFAKGLSGAGSNVSRAAAEGWGCIRVHTVCGGHVGRYLGIDGPSSVRGYAVRRRAVGKNEEGGAVQFSCFCTRWEVCRRRLEVVVVCVED